MKLHTRLVLDTVYDDGGYEDFDPSQVLHALIEHAVNNGLLTGDEGPVTVDSYEVKVHITETSE